MTLADIPRTSSMTGLRRRGLAFPEVVAQSVSAVAPSAAMVAIPPLVLIQAGPATMPALLVASALALLVAWCLTHLARRMRTVGGLYTFAVKGLGVGGGLLAGWSLVIAYAAVAAGALVGATAYAASLVRLPMSPVVLGSLCLVIGCAATLLVVRGVQLSARFALALETASIVVVVSVLALLTVTSKPAPTPLAAGTSGFTWGSFALAVVLGVAGFMGFESASTLGVEASRPLVTVPRAILWTPVVAAVLLLGAAASEVALIHGAPAEVLTSPVPVAAMVEQQGLGWVVSLLDVGIVSSFLAAVSGALNALGRVVFTMGREGVLPRALGRTHPRWATPHIALAAALPVVVGVPLALLASGRPPLAVFVGELTLSAMGYLAAYVLSCSAVPLFLRRIGELTWIVAVAGVAGALLCAATLAGAVVGSARADGGFTAVVFAALLLPAAPWAWWAHRRGLRLGLHDETTRSAVLPGSIPVGRS